MEKTKGKEHMKIISRYAGGHRYLILAGRALAGVSALLTLILIALTNYIQYNATFLSTYRESGVRRTALAETLRKLPLSYFGKKNIADLTTNIMGDCAQIETASSHWIPELIGAVISTGIVGISLFFFYCHYLKNGHRNYSARGWNPLCGRGDFSSYVLHVPDACIETV